MCRTGSHNLPSPLWGGSLTPTGGHADDSTFEKNLRRAACHPAVRDDQ